MTDSTAPPDQTGLVLNNGDTLHVEVNGIAYGTLINNGGNEYVDNGLAYGTLINGGTEYVGGGTSIGTTINGGTEFDEFGTSIGTIINVGGIEYDQGGASISAIINEGGQEFVQNGSTATNTTINGPVGFQLVDGGTSIGTTIKAGGSELVYNGGTANNTIIEDGGIEHVLTSGTANTVIFAGSNSLLELDQPSGLTGTIINWHVGDKIDFLNTTVTGVNETGNTLTVTYGDHQTASYSLSGQQANTQFKLQPDGGGGTDLILQQLPLGSPVFSAATAGTIVYTAEYGVAPSATELNVLTQFTEAQFAYGQQIGVMDPEVYAYQALGAALASTASHFQSTFGPSNPSYPNSATGDAAFATDAYAHVFGHPGSSAQVQQFVSQLQFFESLYTAAGTFGNPGNIDLSARGAIYGQMLGVEAELNQVPIVGSAPAHA